MNNDPRIVRLARVAVQEMPLFRNPPNHMVDQCKERYPAVYQSISEVERNVVVRHTVLVSSFVRVRNYWCEVPEPVFENLVATVLHQLNSGR